MDLPLSISETQSRLKKGEVRMIELVEGYFQRIRAFNSDFNIYLTLNEENAYELAKKYDQLLESKSDSVFTQYPLFGACIGHKDLYLTKDLRTTAASKLLESYVPQYSSTVVSKLDNAGGIILGKLNCDAWAHGSSGENSDFGPTKNPWNKEYVPGGSSSGSGAALAAHMAMVTTGSDTCGSIRLPANYTGTVGLKVTYGSTSRFGVVAMASSLDTMGPMTFTIEDSKRMFDVMRGSDGRDATCRDHLYKEVSDDKKYVIGVPKEFFGDGLDPIIAKEIEKAKDVLEKKGVSFKEVSLPLSPYGISVYYIIQPAEVSSNLGRYDGVRYGNGRDSFGSEAKRRIMLGTYVLSAGYYDAYYKKAMAVRDEIRHEVEEVFRDVDAIIAPVAPTSPFKLGEKVDDPLAMYLTDIYAATANLTGIPSLALPSGFTKDGLPLGFQIMGKHFGEYDLFEIGKRFHEGIGWTAKVAKL